MVLDIFNPNKNPMAWFWVREIAKDYFIVLPVDYFKSDIFTCQ